jgi:hypothetical protein
VVKLAFGLLVGDDFGMIISTEFMTRDVPAGLLVMYLLNIVAVGEAPLVGFRSSCVAAITCLGFLIGVQCCLARLVCPSCVGGFCHESEVQAALLGEELQSCPR